MSAENQPSSPRCIACGLSSSRSTRFAAGAHSRNVRAVRRQPRAELPVIHAEPAKASTERGGALVSAPEAKSAGVCLRLRGVQHLLPVLVFRHLRQSERDLFGRGVQHDEDRRLSLFDRPEHIGEEAAFRKIPVLLPSSPRRPASATARRRSRPRAGRRASAAQRICGKRRRSSVMWPTKSVRSSPSRAEIVPADPADLVVLAIGVVVAVLGVADLVAGQNQRHALRQQQAGELVLAQAGGAARRSPGSSVGPSWPQLLLWLSLEPSRLSSPLASLCFSL